ncbi:hypothetical protein IAT40_006347 [Kwoniella sp. CBS 6097]
MITAPLLSLFLLLPTLALGSGGHANRMDVRSHARQRNHARNAALINTEEAHMLRRQHIESVEHKMAKRNAGRELARRKADGSKCRQRGVAYTPTASGTSTTSATSAVNSSSVTSAASSATDATATQTTTQADSQSQDAQPSSTTSAEAQQTSQAAQQSQSQSQSSPASYSGHTPNGNKAGVSAGDSLGWLSGKLGWWYDWSADPSGECGDAIAVPMIWGGGSADGEDAARLEAFKNMAHVPEYIIGFEEPDCAAGSGSAGMDVQTAISIWNQYVVPKGEAGSILVGPSMCKQAAESGWLGPFMNGVTRKPDIMNIHVNKNSKDGIMQDIDHYWNTYGLPMWVTEFACVDDSTAFVPCTDQSEIDSFIHTAVDVFESDSRIAGYAYSNGYGLGDVWPMVSNGQLTASGHTYLAALSKYH